MRCEPKPASSMKLVLGIPLLLMALLLAFEPSQIDLALEDLLYVPGTGFIGNNSWFLENVLHDWAKRGVIAVGVIALAGALAGYLFGAGLDKKRWLYVFLSMAIASSAVMPLKRLTEVHCPWSLDRYGGVEHYSPLTSARATPVEKAGKCWPGGHASSGFCLFALFFALKDIRPRAARVALLVAMGLGITFSVGRMLQGAHFLSHNVWTALIDWTVSALLYQLMLRPAARAAALYPACKEPACKEPACMQPAISASMGTSPDA